MESGMHRPTGSLTRARWLTATLSLATSIALLGGLTPQLASAQRAAARHRAAAATPPAQAVPAGPSDENRAAAREAYGRAQQLFRDGDYAGSEAAFLAAYEAVPNPVVLMGVGESRERSGNVAGAIEAFERYLAERTDAPDADAVRTRIANLRATPGTLALSSTPDGAAIDLDREDTHQLTPAEISAPAGRHEVTLHLAGHEEATAEVELLPGARAELALSLASDVAEPALGDGAPIPETSETNADDAEEEPEDVNTGVWISAGVSAGALVMGTVLGFLALSQETDFNDAPSADSADRGEKLALFADVAFGVAAAAAITGIILHFTAGSDDDHEDATATRLNVAPAVGPHGAGLAAQLRF